MISMATPSIAALIAVDTKTALDSSSITPTSTTAPSMSLQFSTRLEELQFIKLHQENDGTYCLQGFKGTPEKLKLPNNDNILKLHYSIRINDLKQQVLRIEKRKQNLTINPDPLDNNIIINTGEIHFKNGQIVHLTDNAATLIPNDSSYVNHRVKNLLDLNELGLPIDKLTVLNTDAKEANARAQALASMAKLKKENKAATVEPTAVASTNASASATAIPAPGISPLRWTDLPNSTAAFTKTIITANPQHSATKTTDASSASATAASSVAIAARGNQTVPGSNPPANTGIAPPPLVFNVQAEQQLRAALTATLLTNGLDHAGAVDVDESLSELGSPITITDMDSNEGWCGSCCM